MRISSRSLAPVPHLRRVVLTVMVSAASVALLSGIATGASFTTDTLTFDTPVQNIWGPGSSSAAFSKSGFLIGNTTTGVSYSSSASSGTVSSHVTGRLGTSFTDIVPFGSSSAVPVGVDFLGGASSFRSDLGANIRIAGELFGAINDFTILDRDYGLNIVQNFTSETPRTATGADDFAAAQPGIGLPTGGIGISGTAGVSLDIQQDATLRVLRLDGTLRAQHADSGTLRNTAFSLDTLAGDTLSLDLGIPGLWELDFVNVSLRGDYTSAFSGEFNPFIGGGIGIFCGDPFDSRDNFGCASEGGVKADEVIPVNLFTSPLITLNYSGFANIDGFDILVQPVPEPGTVALLLTAAGAAASLHLYRRRRRR